MSNKLNQVTNENLIENKYRSKNGLFVKIFKTRGVRKMFTWSKAKHKKVQKFSTLKTETYSIFKTEFSFRKDFIYTAKTFYNTSIKGKAI